MQIYHIFILIILFVLIYINFLKKENFNTDANTNKYNIILINHKNYQIIIIKTINNNYNKIYKIYKN